MAKRRMDPMMAKAVAYDRLSAKASRAGEHRMSTHYWEMSQRLKEQVYRKRQREAAAAKEKKLFERDLKELGLTLALAAARQRRESSE